MAPTRRCGGCGERFPPIQLRHVGLKLVCSADCRARVLEETSSRAAERPRSSTGRPRIPSEVRQAVRARDGHACRWCGSGKTLSLHHVLYRSQGGPDVEENLITLCLTHHSEAHSNVRWREVLQLLLWVHYAEGRRLTVPEVARRMERELGVAS